MGIKSNRGSVTTSLTFFDDSQMQYTFSPGELTYDDESGLVLTLSIEMANGTTEDLVLRPRPSRINDKASWLQFLAPFGISVSGGMLLAKIAGRSNPFTSFAGFLLAASPVGGVINDWLEDVKRENSSYYTTDSKHAMRIPDPIYLRV